CAIVVQPNGALLPLAGVFEAGGGGAAGVAVRAEGIVADFAGLCRATHGHRGAAQACPKLVER
ncbi:hypothetical protein KC957_00955, partial [Candidatus Saccharibacteria bacterium]|nr:hypothetical protein [Candidatus Saccharibacteria bacterium]